MKKIKLSVFFIISILSLSFAASAYPVLSINEARHEIVTRYVSDLGNANLQDMLSLFEENGSVISTSRGRMNAKEFFNAFLPEISEATTTIKNMFIGDKDINHVAVRFHFSFTLKDGEKGDGEYIDDFVFAEGSDKLSEVIMFENLKYQS